jgi:hypothetical protein
MPELIGERGYWCRFAPTSYGLVFGLFFFMALALFSASLVWAVSPTNTRPFIPTKTIHSGECGALANGPAVDPNAVVCPNTLLRASMVSSSGPTMWMVFMNGGYAGHIPHWSVAKIPASTAIGTMLLAEKNCTSARAWLIESAFFDTAATLSWASPAANFAASASSCAVLADAAASPATSVITASNWSFFALSSLAFERNRLLIDATSPVAPVSPKTPASTTTVATTSNRNLHSRGLSGGLMMPRPQSCRSSKYSENMTMSSPAIPMPTAIAQSQPTVSQNPDDPARVSAELSSAEMELFKADIQLSREEEAVGQLEGRLARLWIITAIALICLAGGLIVAFGLNTVYKKYIYSRYNA